MKLYELLFFKRLLPKQSTITLYHTSRTLNRTSILAQGLLPKEKLNGSIINYPPRLFFSTRFNDIATMDFIEQWDDVDIWKVKLPVHKLTRDRFFHLSYHYYTEEPIAPEDVKLALHIPPNPYETAQVIAYLAHCNKEEASYIS